MDENKLKVLKEIGYEGLVCCGTCVHGKFRLGRDFGICDKFIYAHLKHSDKKRQISIYRYAKCKYIKSFIKDEVNKFLDYLD